MRMRKVTAFFTLFLAAASHGLVPRVKWLYASAGLGLDYWGGAGTEGNGFAWRKKDRAYNPPQTTSSFSLGGSAALTPRVGVFLSAPFFYNRIEAYADRYGTSQPSLSATGVGDVEIGVPV